MLKKTLSVAFLVALAGCGDTDGGSTYAQTRSEKATKDRGEGQSYPPLALENRDWQIEGVRMEIPGRIILSVANDGSLNADLQRIEKGKKVIYESETGKIDGAEGRLKEPLSENAKVLAAFTTFSIETGAGGTPFIQTANGRYALKPLVPAEEVKP